MYFTSEPKEITIKLEAPKVSSFLITSTLIPSDADDINNAIKTVIFHNPATIVKWIDGTKTVVKCSPDDVFDKEKGLMACIIKKLTGNTGRWNEILKGWTDEDS